MYIQTKGHNKSMASTLIVKVQANNNICNTRKIKLRFMNELATASVLLLFSRLLAVLWSDSGF